MTTETAAVTTVDLVERRQADLKAAVASADEKQIAEAQAELDRARVPAATEAQHRAERARAQRELDAEARGAEKAAKKQLADEVEAELRAQTPEVRFGAPGGRTVVVTLGGRAGIDVGYAVEACRRIAYASARAFAERVITSRSAGRIVEETDWLTKMLDNSADLALHIRRGVVRVEEKP